MAYFWLNQKDSNNSSYQDKEGEIYHYRDHTTGYKQLTSGDHFVYYRPGEYVLFGTGRIGKIEQRERSAVDSKSPVNYYAHIKDYHAFDPPLNARDIKENISFLRGRNGLSGVPQEGIRRIDEKDFQRILDATGVEMPGH